jgi:hypothetical protein
VKLCLSPVIVLALVATAMAGPKRVLVLPLDGNADPATRAKLNTSVQKLAKEAAAGAVVTVGDATFDETAAAVGCDPTAPKCAISVRSTLGVDELVYGTVTNDPSGQATIVIRRSSVTSNPPREDTATLPAGEPADRAEAQLAPLFGVTVTEPVPEPAPLPPPPPPPPRDNSRRNIGIACAGGGGVLVVIGLALWASESSKQDQIDNAPTQTLSQLRALQELEDKAQTYAIVGDLMLLGGLALGGYGGWLLYKDHQERSVAVTPTATPNGPAVVLRGTW